MEGRSLPGPARRVRLLFAAEIAAGPRGGLPVAPLLAQALLSLVFCGLVAGALSPFAYGLYALGVLACLLAIPLVGDLSWLLYDGAAEEWLATQPVRPWERRVARTLHLQVLLTLFALASMAPAVWFAPEGTPLAGRLGLFLFGVGWAHVVAFALLCTHHVLSRYAQGLLILLQTLVVVGVTVGLVLGVRYIPNLATFEHPQEVAGLAWFPATWFAAPLAPNSTASNFLLAIVASVVGLLALYVLPAPSLGTQRAGRSLLERMLAPVRRLATRFWVRADERAAFDLVYDALPREREVALRTYPIVGIPLAFLVVSSIGPEEARARQDVMALLFFTAGVYLPVLLAQLPASASYQARWILDCAPTGPGAVMSGALKALACRFVVPLYALLTLIAAFQAGPLFALRLAPAGALLALFVLRALYRQYVVDPPLSIPSDRVRMDLLDGSGPLIAIALGLTLVAILANRFLTGLEWGLLTALLLVGIDRWWEKRLRRRMG